jgi:hypothetical protein
MTLYRNTTTGEIRDLDDSLIAAWQAAGNPKTGQWEAYSPPPPPPPAPPSPDWPGFLTAIQSSPDLAAALRGAKLIVNNEVDTATGERKSRLLLAYMALESLSTVLLASRDPESGPELFRGAWIRLRRAELVSPEVSIAMTQLATFYNLPENLIRSLNAPE